MIARPLQLARATVLALLLAPASAGATANDCNGVPDGSPCRSICETDGVCRRGMCVGGIALPDGAPCASGHICTVDDRCQAGQCVPGPLVACAPGLCGPEACIEGRGCRPVNPCGGGGDDGGVSPDLASVQRDGGAADGATDLASVDLARSDLLDSGSAGDGAADDGGPADGGAGAVDAGGDAAPVHEDGAAGDGALPADGGTATDAEGPLPSHDLGPDGGVGDGAGEWDGSGGGGTGIDDLLYRVHGSGCALARRPANPMQLLVAVGVVVALLRRRRTGVHRR